MSKPADAPIQQPDFAQIRRTGEWWTNPWFFDSRVHAALGVDEAKVTAALERVRGLFPAAWYVEAERKMVAREEWHPAVRLLSTGGTMGVGCLLEMAEVLDAIEASGAGAPGLRSRLLTSTEFEGAKSEGRIARLLRADGLPYSFGGRAGHDGPSHDITVHSEPVSFCVEVTRVLNTWYEGPIAHLSNRVMHGLMAGLTGRGYEVEFEGSLIEILPGLRSDKLPDDLRPDFMLAGWLADRFISRTLEAARSSNAEFAIEEPGVGSVHVSAAVSGTGAGSPSQTQGSIHGPPIDTGTMVRRVVLAVIDKATRQLPRDRAGVVALSFPFGSLDLPFAEAVLRAAMESCGPHLTHLSGALLLTSAVESEGLIATLIPVENPAAQVDLRSIPWSAMHRRTRMKCH